MFTNLAVFREVDLKDKTIYIQVNCSLLFEPKNWVPMFRLLSTCFHYDSVIFYIKRVKFNISERSGGLWLM